MTAAERARRQAMTAFNRSAGQIKRYHPELNPAEYVEGKTTAFQILKALDKLKLDAEQIEIGKRVEAYEKKLDIIYEEMLKRESLEKFQEERDQSYQSLNENWGLDWTREDYDEFWDTFGDSDLVDFYGSEQIIYLGERVINFNKNQSKIIGRGSGGQKFSSKGGKISPKKVAKIAKKTMKKLSGKGYTQQKAIDYLNKTLEKELDKVKKGKK